MFQGKTPWKDPQKEFTGIWRKTPQSPVRCGIFVFCLLSFPQNERKIYKLRQLSLYQFLYRLSTEPSISKKVFCKSKPRWLCAQKIYKLRQTMFSVCIFFSRFEGTRGDKNQIFRTWVSSLTLAAFGVSLACFMYEIVTVSNQTYKICLSLLFKQNLYC